MLCSVLGASHTQPRIPQNNLEGFRSVDGKMRPELRSDLLKVTIRVRAGISLGRQWSPPSFSFISLPLIGQEAGAQLPGTRPSWLSGSGRGSLGVQGSGWVWSGGARLAWGLRAGVGDSLLGCIPHTPEWMMAPRTRGCRTGT